MASTSAAATQQQPTGTPPAGTSAGGPGGMADATGTEAGKAKAAALAESPGQVERVVKTADGYVVHVATSEGEQHVAVSSSLRGSRRWRRIRPAGPEGAAPPSGRTPPSGATPPPGTTPPTGTGTTPPSSTTPAAGTSTGTSA